MADKKKIIKAKLTNPDATLRWIEAQTGIPMKSVQRVIKSIPNFDKNWHMVDCIDEILNDIMNITKKNIKKYDLKEEELQTRELRDLSAIAKENWERKRIIQWEPTEITKHDIDLSKLSPKEIMDYIQTTISAK